MGEDREGCEDRAGIRPPEFRDRCVTASGQMRPRRCPSLHPHSRRTAAVLSLLHPHEKERVPWPHHAAPSSPPAPPVSSLLRLRPMHRHQGRGARRSRCGRGGAALIPGRATFRSKCRTPTSSSRRPPTTAPWRTSSFRSRRRTCGSSAAAGPARSPSASSASPRRSPASTCGSTPAACASCIGTRPPSGPTCSTAAPASPRSTRRAASSSTMSASATSGTSPRASRTRSRARA